MFKVVGPLDPEKDHFVGRVQELTQMSEWVKSAETYGLVLGASQTGKTSLLLKLQANLQPEYTCIYLNLHPFSNLDQGQVYRHLSEQIVEKLYSSLEKKEWPQANDGPTFIRFLKHLSKNIPSPKIMLLLDEMDALSQQSLGSLANTIRGIFHQRMEEHELQKFVFIYAAKTDVLTLAERRGSPLRNITECLYLEDLSRSETIEVLKFGFAPEGIQIEKAIADHIYGWTHGHPYLTQALGNMLIELRQRDESRLDQTSVEKAVQLLQTQGDRNLQHVVNALERAKHESPALLQKVRDILESRVKTHFSRTNPEILQLELMGIVREGKDGYCTIRNQIYQQILKDYLQSGTTTVSYQPSAQPGAVPPAIPPYRDKNRQTSGRVSSPSVRKLANLIRVRCEAGGRPYVLLLGSSLSLTPEIRRAVCESDNWETFWTDMERLSDTERCALMRGPLAGLNLASGYHCLAELTQAGYFNTILTANIDDTLDNALRILPVSKYKVLCHHDQISAQEITLILSQPASRVKVVKLRGDINAFKLPLTPEGQFEFPPMLAEAMEQLLSQDTILVGDIPYDTDIQRCIGKGDGALWVVVPEKPQPGGFLYNAKQARPKGEVITGPEAEFMPFFYALAEALELYKTIPLNEPNPQRDPKGFIKWVEDEDRPDRVTPEVLSILAGPLDDPTHGSPEDIAPELVKWLIERYPQRVAVFASTNEQFLLAMAKSPEAVYSLFDSLISNFFEEVATSLASNLTPAVWKRLKASQGARDRLWRRLSEAEIISRVAPLPL